MTQELAHAEIVKVDEDKRLVFGWASIIKDESGKILLDRQDDFIDSEDELEGAAYDYVLNSRDGGEMHVRRGVAKMVESVVFTEEKQRALGIPVGSMPTGWWIGFKVTDNSVWNQVKKGEYAGFSVHGSGRRESMELPLSKITEIGKSVTTKEISISETIAKTQMLNTELSKVGDKPGHPFRGNQHTGGGKKGGGTNRVKESPKYTGSPRRATGGRGGQLITPVGSRTGSGTAPKPKISLKPKSKKKSSSQRNVEYVPSNKAGFVVPKGSPYARGAKAGVKGKKRPKVKRGK